MDRLTVIIPTYNREERLRRTLEILERQTNSDFYVYILDNHSGYAVDNLISEFDSDFRERITFKTQPVNIGMHGNLADIFLQNIKGWVWMLSDDDLPREDAIETIRGDISSAKEWVIHYSLMDQNIIIQDAVIDSIENLFEWYENLINIHNCSGMAQGDFIFLSNKVYNMDVIQQYCGDVYRFAYTAAPQLIPIFSMLNSSGGKLRISTKKIVDFDEPNGDHWNWLSFAQDMVVISRAVPSLTKGQKNTLYKITQPHYCPVTLSINDDFSWEKVSCVKTLYNEVYKNIITYKEKIDFRIKFYSIIMRNLFRRV